MTGMRDGFDLGYPSSRYKPWKMENQMDKEDGWNSVGDGKFDDRILNEEPKPDVDYNITLESHLRPFLTAVGASLAITLIAIALTPISELHRLFF